MGNLLGRHLLLRLGRGSSTALLLLTSRRHVLPQLGLSDGLLSVEGAVDAGVPLQLLERHGHHAVAASLRHSQLESVKVGQVGALQGRRMMATD